MSVAIDSGPTAGTAGSGSPHNVTFNNVAGTFMVNMRGFGGGAGDTLSGSTYNGVAMTNGTSDSQAGVGGTQQARIDYLVTPSTGSNTMASSYSSIGAEENEVALSFTGAGPSPFTAQTPVKGSSTGATISFTLAAGEIGIAMLSAELGGSVTGSLDAGTNLSHTATAAFNGSNFWAAYVTSTGNITWSWSGSHAFVVVGAIIKLPPTAALTGTATASITEADVVAGGKTIILTLTNDTYVPASGFQTIALRGTGKSGNAINGGNVTLTFDVGAGAPQTGDYVVVWGGHGTTVTTLAAPGAAAPADGTYTQVGIHTGTAPIFGAWIKKMGATPDTKVVCSGGGSASDAVAYACEVYSGVDLSTPQDQTATTAGPTTSTNPNGASITTVTDNAWVLTMAGSVVNDATPGTISGYTNQQNNSATDTSPFSTSGMTKLVASHGAEDPGAYSSWSSGAWYAITMALRPAATTPFNDARAALITGIDSAQSEAAGWDAKVKANLPVANVVRTSDTVCTVTLQAQADYDITAQETITATIPASILSGGAQIVATPTFTVDTSGGGGTFKALWAVQNNSIVGVGVH